LQRASDMHPCYPFPFSIGHPFSSLRYVYRSLPRCPCTGWHIPKLIAPVLQLRSKSITSITSATSQDSKASESSQIYSVIMSDSIISTDSNLAPSIPSTKGRQKRAVATWDHSRSPKPDEPQYVKKHLAWYCKYCPDYRCISTTAARSHLSSQHSIQVDEVRQAQPQLTS